MKDEDEDEDDAPLIKKKPTAMKKPAQAPPAPKKTEDKNEEADGEEEEEEEEEGDEGTKKSKVLRDKIKSRKFHELYDNLELEPHVKDMYDKAVFILSVCVYNNHRMIVKI